MQRPSSQPPTNPQIELAKERNRAAAERTLMAWIRTSLSLISFGFGIDQLMTAIRLSISKPINTSDLSRLIGLSLVGLGTIAMVTAVYQHLQELRHIRRETYQYKPRLSLSVIVALSLVVIGLVAFVGILIQANSS
jgi:putative membrane protein